MEILRFIFSRFWVWLGFVILVCAVGSEIAGIAKARKRKRTITSYSVDDRSIITITDASDEEVRQAMVMCGLREAERAEGKNE